jgi:hypothetical protein
MVGSGGAVAAYQRYGVLTAYGDARHAEGTFGGVHAVGIGILATTVEHDHGHEYQEERTSDDPVSFRFHIYRNKWGVMMIV